MTLQMLVGTGEIYESGARPAQVSLTRSWLGGAATFDDREWYCTRAEIRWRAPAHLIVLTRQRRNGANLHPAGGRSGASGGEIGRELSPSFPRAMARQAVYEEAALKYSAVWIAPSFLDTLAPKGGLDRALINFSDPLLAGLLGGLREAAGAAHPPDEAYLEQLPEALSPQDSRPAHAALGRSATCEVELAHRRAGGRVSLSTPIFTGTSDWLRWQRRQV